MKLTMEEAARKYPQWWALRTIAKAQHEPDCLFKLVPRWECPTCPSPSVIAQRALDGSTREGF